MPFDIFRFIPDPTVMLISICTSHASCLPLFWLNAKGSALFKSGSTCDVTSVCQALSQPVVTGSVAAALSHLFVTGSVSVAAACHLKSNNLKAVRRGSIHDSLNFEIVFVLVG